MRNLFLMLCVLCGFAVITFAAEPSAAPGEKLDSLAFLTAHEWDAKLPDSRDGKKVSIHARFDWAQNHQVILFSSAFIRDGKAAPYIDGMYLWNPEKRAIAMIYADSGGTFTEGTVRAEAGTLVHEFRQLHPDGKAEEYVSHVASQDAEKWTNEIFARQGDQLKKIVQVQYVAAP